MPLTMDSPAVGNPRVDSGRARRSRAVELGDNVVSLNLPREADRQVVLDWAVATVAQAEQRVAALQARIEYLEGLSVTDELTGLLNRRGFLAQLERALAAARRGGPHGVLMICDLDDFKAINDRYGHLVGDDALCQTAAPWPSSSPPPRSPSTPAKSICASASASPPIPAMRATTS